MMKKQAKVYRGDERESRNEFMSVPNKNTLQLWVYWVQIFIQVRVQKQKDWRAYNYAF